MIAVIMKSKIWPSAYNNAMPNDPIGYKRIVVDSLLFC